MGVIADLEIKMNTSQFHSTIAVAAEFPSGSVVFHRGTGARGIIVGFATYHDGSSRILVDWAEDKSYDFVMPCSISSTPIPDTADGDDWKAGV